MRFLLTLFSLSFLTLFASAQTLLDPTFATNGYTQDDTFLGDAVDIEVQPDNKIVMALNEGDNSRNIYLVRYNEDGTLDQSFGTNGKANAWVSDDAELHGLALQPDGKILAIGHSEYCNQIVCGFDNLIVTRFHTDGTVDTNFAEKGILRSGPVFGPLVMGALGCQVKVLSNGKIIIAGTLRMQTSQTPGITLDAFIARLEPDGSVDSTFGPNGNGVLAFRPPGFYILNDFVMDAQGNFFGAGTADNFIAGVNIGDAFAFKATSAGQIDNSFGTNGFLTFNPSARDKGHAIAVRPDGKILVSGTVQDSVDLSAPYSAFLTLLEPDGSFSPTTSSDYTYYPMYKPSSVFTSLLPLADNRVLIGGFVDSAYTAVDGLVGRILPNGDPDTSFSGTGNAFSFYPFGEYATFQSGAFVNCLTTLANGQVLAGGRYNPLPQNARKAVLLMRITPLAMPTGWEEDVNVERSGLQVYPNPVEDRFFVGLPQGLSGDVSISLTDLTGKEVARWNRFVQDREAVELNKPFGLENGVYVLRVGDGSVYEVVVFL